MSDIVWENPPSHGNSRDRWELDGLLQEVTTRPGEWARITTDTKPEDSRRVCHRLKNRVSKPSGNWTFMSRTLPDGRGAVYAYFEPNP